MNSKEFFTTGIRLFGVWELLRCIDYVLEGYDLKVGFYRSTLNTIGSSYTHSAVYLVAGLYLLAGAPHIVRFLFPPRESTNVSISPSTPDI